MTIDCGFFPLRGGDFDSGRPVLIKGSEVYHTGWENGTAKSLADMWPGLPDDFTTGIDGVTYVAEAGRDRDVPSYGLIKGDRVCLIRLPHSTFAIKSVAEIWPDLPDDFKTGFDAVSGYTSEFGATSLFFKGDRVYLVGGSVQEGGFVSHLGSGAFGSSHKLPSDFLAGIDVACFLAFSYAVFIKGDKACISSRGDSSTAKLADLYKPLPSGWM